MYLLYFVSAFEQGFDPGDVVHYKFSLILLNSVKCFMFLFQANSHSCLASFETIFVKSCTNMYIITDI